MRPKTSATQVMRYDHLNGTKNTPNASKCMIANGVTPTTEMRAPFGRGIDRDRVAVAMLGEFPTENLACDAVRLSVLRATCKTGGKLSSTIQLIQFTERENEGQANYRTGGVIASLGPKASGAVSWSPQRGRSTANMLSF